MSMCADPKPEPIAFWQSVALHVPLLAKVALTIFAMTPFRLFFKGVPKIVELGGGAYASTMSCMLFRGDFMALVLPQYFRRNDFSGTGNKATGIPCT